MSTQPKTTAVDVQPGDEIEIVGLSLPVLVERVVPDSSGIRIFTPKGGSVHLRSDEKVTVVGREQYRQGRLF